MQVPLYYSGASSVPLAHFELQHLWNCWKVEFSLSFNSIIHQVEHDKQSCSFSYLSVVRSKERVGDFFQSLCSYERIAREAPYGAAHHLVIQLRACRLFLRRRRFGHIATWPLLVSPLLFLPSDHTSN